MKHKQTLEKKAEVALEPVNISGVQSNHIFSASTILKPASSIQDRVSRLQRHSLKMVGQMSDFDKNC